MSFGFDENNKNEFRQVVVVKIFEDRHASLACHTTANHNPANIGDRHLSKMWNVPREGEKALVLAASASATAEERKNFMIALLQVAYYSEKASYLATKICIQKSDGVFTLFAYELVRHTSTHCNIA